MIQVLLLLNYVISFYVIFHHISQNLLVLREQLSFIDNEDVHAMHDAVYTKYIMFKYVHISTCVFPFGSMVFLTLSRDHYNIDSFSVCMCDKENFKVQCR